MMPRGPASEPKLPVRAAVPPATVAMSAEQQGIEAQE